MDRKEAQLILSGLRPGGLEANEPFFAEALALVEADPELQAWWQAQQEFDRRVSARLREVPAPKSLRQRCLALAQDRLLLSAALAAPRPARRGCGRCDPLRRGHLVARDQ